MQRQEIKHKMGEQRERKMLNKTLTNFKLRIQCS